MMPPKSPIFSTLIHIGAGRATELDAWLEFGVESIVLIEPHPRLAEHLRQRTRVMPQVTVLEMALSSTSDLNKLYEYNLPELNSLRPATGLREVFPGLKTVRSYPVETGSLKQILEQYLPQVDQKAHLVIEAAGEETALIEELLASEDLERIIAVTLTAGLDVLYEGTKPAAELLEQLKAKGYELQSEKMVNPEWGRWELQRNPLVDEIVHLKQQLAQSKSALAKEKETSHQTVQKLQAEVQQLNSSSKKQAEEFKVSLEFKESELAKQTAAHQAALKTHVTELEQLKSALAKEKESSHQAVQKLQAEVQQLNSSSEKQAEEFQVSLKLKETELKKYQEEQQSKLESQAQELEQTKVDLQKNKEWFANRKKQALELEDALEKEKVKSQTLTKENELLKSSQETSNVAFQLLNDRLEKLFSEQKAQIQQSTNALGKHVTQSFVDQRQHYQSVLGLQHYLESGEQPLEFGGWAIGSDVASHLIRLLGQNNYDLIIEFGSGTSTVLMAKVIAKQLADSAEHVEYTQLDYDSSTPVASQTKTKTRQVINKTKSLEVFEVPRRILSFEQDKQYYQQTKQTLLNQGLDGLVELALAPLVPTAYSERAKAPLFYDCDKQLSQVSQLYGNRTARILVLVDGPFSPKADPLVREPALAHLLQHLSAHHLDVVLDDSKREGEQQVIQHWRDLCEERGLSYQEQTLEADKGALWFTVTP